LLIKHHPKSGKKFITLKIDPRGIGKAKGNFYIEKFCLILEAKELTEKKCKY